MGIGTAPRPGGKKDKKKSHQDHQRNVGNYKSFFKKEATYRAINYSRLFWYGFAIFLLILLLLM